MTIFRPSWIACGLSLLWFVTHGCHGHHDDKKGKKVIVVEPVVLEESLATGNLLRDPNQGAPSAGETLALTAYDTQLRSLALEAGLNHAYDNDLLILRQAAGISPALVTEVVADVRLHRKLEAAAGGLAGHQVLLLDGKLLDILLEYAVFLAFYESGFVDVDPILALDEIVYLHNGVLGATSGGFVYYYGDLSPNLKFLADTRFRELLSGVLFHKFGHVFFFHSLAALRDLGYLEPVIFPLALEVDAADVVAGMLLAKTGTELSFGLESLDILAFYAIQRFEVQVTYPMVLGDLFQNEPLTTSWLPLVARKASRAFGYERFADYWDLCGCP